MFDDSAVEGREIPPGDVRGRLIPARLLQRHGGDCYRGETTARRRDADEATARPRRLSVRVGVPLVRSSVGRAVAGYPARGENASARWAYRL